MLKSYHVLLYCIVVFSLMGCSSNNYKQTFETRKKSYDPFSISVGHDLLLPPVYYVSAQEISNEHSNLRKESDRVKSILFGEPISYKVSSNTNIKLDNADLSLLKLTKSDKNKSLVRDKLNTESSNIVNKSSAFLNKISSNNKALNDKVSENYKNTTE